ncbi:MAG: alanine racemase [Bdellovibrionales bacterium]
MYSSPQLTVDLSALQANYRLLSEMVNPSETAAVVKANAYGVDVAPVARALAQAGCRTFFTAYAEEALQLRAAAPEAAIAPLHGVNEHEQAEAYARNITPVLNSLDALAQWTGFARKLGRKLPAFIHLDTGMNRLGLGPDEQERLIGDPTRLDGLEITGWMSHFSCSEEFDNPLTTRQRDRFKTLLARLPKAPATLCNSSGIFWGRDYIFDIARPGVAIYGVNPTPGRPNPMRGVIELKVPILQIRDVDTPMTVGYGATHRIARKGRIATLALGYADGYLRSLSNQGQVKIENFLAPVVGRISMDLTTIDVSDIPEAVAHTGALATVIGPHRPVDTVAREAGTTGYEILTSLGSRHQRHYIAAGGA